MLPRACIICGNRAVAGRSRCSTHGRSSPKAPSPHDSEHRRLAREVVAEADVCALCGLPPTQEDPLEGGHIVPASRGGRNVKSNYRAEHRSHNRAEGARLARQRGGGGPPRG